MTITRLLPSLMLMARSLQMGKCRLVLSGSGSSVSVSAVWKDMDGGIYAFTGSGSMAKRRDGRIITQFCSVSLDACPEDHLDTGVKTVTVTPASTSQKLGDLEVAVLMRQAEKA